MKLTREDVIGIVEKANTEIDLDQLTDEIHLSDIGADSLDIMEILLGVQEQTGEEIPDSDIESLRSIEEILAYVNTR